MSGDTVNGIAIGLSIVAVCVSAIPFIIDPPHPIRAFRGWRTRRAHRKADA